MEIAPLACRYYTEHPSPSHALMLYCCPMTQYSLAVYINGPVICTALSIWSQSVTVKGNAAVFRILHPHQHHQLQHPQWHRSRLSKYTWEQTPPHEFGTDGVVVITQLAYCNGKQEGADETIIISKRIFYSVTEHQEHPSEALHSSVHDFQDILFHHEMVKN